MQNIKYSNMYINEVLQKLRETNSSNEKKEILKQTIGITPFFKEFLVATFNPHINYFIKKIPEYKPNKSELGLYGIDRILKHNMLSVFSERLKTGNDAIKHLTAILEDLNHQDAQALERLIERDLKCGVEVGLINKVSPGLIPTYPCMLCTPYEESLAQEFDFPAFSQVKCDGLRGNIIIQHGKVTTKSRNGKDLQLENVFDFTHKIHNGVLDGEILVRDPKEPNKFLPRKTSNGIINKCAKGTATQEEMDLVVMVCWDFIAIEHFLNARDWTVPYVNRFNALKATIEKLDNGRLMLVETRTVGSLHEAKQHFTHAVERGLEGTILKTQNGIWTNGRPKHQIKLKLENECDLIVKEAIEGTGKYKGKLGSFVCSSADGLLNVNVGTGISDEEREKFWKNKPIGSVVAVRYNEKITNSAGGYSLFLPRLIEVREDKTEADKLESIK